MGKNSGNGNGVCRPVVPGCAGCAMAHPDFGRSVNPISTRGDRLCPPNYYWHTRIFRPSNGPVNTRHNYSNKKKLIYILYQFTFIFCVKSIHKPFLKYLISVLTSSNCIAQVPCLVHSWNQKLSNLELALN